MNDLEKLERIYKEPDWLVKFANSCDRAYCEDVGHPEWHEPFDFSNKERMSQNLAVLPALINGICHLSNRVIGYTVNKMLSNIYNDIMYVNHEELLCMYANIAWNAQQPFRDRIEKMNCYYLLPVEEQRKDLVQIRAGAKVLLDFLNTKK